MMDITKNNLVYWVWLSLAFGASNMKKWSCMEQCGGSVVDTYHAAVSGRLYGLTAYEQSKIREASLEKAGSVLENCIKKNVIAYGYESEGYPSKLRSIDNPPAVLFSTGSLDFLNNRAIIAIVGARKASDYSLRVTERIAGGLAKWGVVVASGCADGIDAMSHMATIRAGGKTVAVVAGGVDYDYPRNSFERRNAIVNNGAIISEHAPGYRPFAGDFVARNRILSGISDGVVITQASKISGALNTASHAVSQNKDVYCVPPKDIFSTEYAGVSSLLRDGATPVFSPKDIMMQFAAGRGQGKEFARDLSMVFDKEAQTSFADDIEIEKKAKRNKPDAKAKGRKTTVPVAQQPMETKVPKKEIDYAALSELQKRLVTEIENGTQLADELSAKLEMDISELFSELTELEMMGYVTGIAGNKFVINR